MTTIYQIMALTQDIILAFLLEHGGKVKNSDLLSKFKEALSCSDPVEKRQNRDLFKSFVNNIAVVKVIDETKYVVVKKKYQGFTSNYSSNARKNDCDDGFSRANAIKHATERKVQPIDEKNNNTYDTFNNNAKVGINSCTADPLPNTSAATGCCYPDYGKQHTSWRNEQVSVRKDLKSRKTGAVFAVVAVKSPNSHSSENQLHSKVAIQESTHHLQAVRITSPDLLLQKSQGTLQDEVVVKNSSEWDNSPEIKRRQLELGFHDTLHQKDSNKSSKTISEPKYSEGVPLELSEHEWLTKSAAGHWDQVYGLLLQDVHLADKKDFISGFTALHWAAKDGNGDMVRKLIDVPRDRCCQVDVNARTHAGYTPLHIAAIHGRDAVAAQLVCEYHASTNMRDNSGKKPYHYLPEGTSLETRELLGDPCVSLEADVPCESVEDEHGLPELPKGFNTLSKLFHPHSSHRKKHRHRPSFHFHTSEDSGEDRREHVLSRRLSEMFH